MMGDEILASVIMPTHNKASYLDLTLASFRHQTERRYQIVVIDDGGDDDTEAIVRDHEQVLPLRYLRREHGGRAAARNAGLSEATGRLLIFSDDDRVVAPGFVAAHVAAHPGGDRVVLGWMRGVATLLEEPLLGPLFPVLVRYLGECDATSRSGLARLASRKDFIAKPQAPLAALETVEPDWERKVTPAVALFGDRLDGFAVPWFIGSTGNMSVPRERVLAVGGFDAGYTGYGMEDTDLCRALWHGGVPFALSRDAVNYHQFHPKPSMGAEMRASLQFFLAKYDDVAALLFAHWFLGYLDLARANELALRTRAADEPGLEALAEELRTGLPAALRVGRTGS